MSASWRGTPASPVPDNVAAFGERYVSFALRQHLSAVHHLPAGLSYLVPAEGLSAFHDAAHAQPGAIAGWLRVRQLRRARLRQARRRQGKA